MCFFKWKLRYPQIWWSQWSHVHNSTFFRHTQHILKKVMFPAIYQYIYIYHLKYLMISQKKSPHMVGSLSQTHESDRRPLETCCDTEFDQPWDGWKCWEIWIRLHRKTWLLQWSVGPPDCFRHLFVVNCVWKWFCRRLSDHEWSDQIPSGSRPAGFHFVRGQGKVGLLAWEDTAEDKAPRTYLVSPWSDTDKW